MKFKVLATLKVDNDTGDYVSPGIIDTQKVSEELALFVKNECDTGRGFVICVDPNDYTEEVKPSVKFDLTSDTHSDIVGDKDLGGKPEDSSDSDAGGDKAEEGAASSPSSATAKESLKPAPMSRKKK